MRILDTRIVSLPEELVLHTASDGQRYVTRGGIYHCGESDDALVRAARFAIKIGSLVGKSVAWIGGGLCVGPRLFATAGCIQTIYEIEKSFAEFCPEGINFVAGDWSLTLSGRYDVIIYDLGGPAPNEPLTPYLNLGGCILPQLGDPNA